MADDPGAVWPAGPEEQRTLRTMDGGVVAESAVLRPDRYAFLRTSEKGPIAIPRGGGLSFAAASFGAGAKAIEFGEFDRILGFDSASGLVEVEAGITLGQLFHFLAAHGRYLPVQPGFGSITVGGCIACNVHGKNPARDGTFISQVQSLRLFHPDHGTIELSESVEPELFRGTCGGFGLTGIIVSATLRTRLLVGWASETSLHPVVDASGVAAFVRQVSARSDLAYVWFDCARPAARSFGRGLVFETRIVSGGVSHTELPPARLSADHGRELPVCLMNGWIVQAINVAYAWRARRRAGFQQRGVARALFPIHGNELYFRLFGRSGFFEYQAIVPDKLVADYLQYARDAGRRLGTGFSLAIARAFAGRSDLLRFDGDGIGFALEMPRNAQSMAFMAALDRYVVDIGARPNIYKDSRLPRAVVEATYPEYEKFRSLRRAWDPRGRFRSELSERLGL
jgi:decaprenylphospho-beta-D-ribofuranose 2-oxidase